MAWAQTDADKQLRPETEIENQSGNFSDQPIIAGSEGGAGDTTNDNTADDVGQLFDEIVVIGSRLPGQVDTDYPPLVELNEDDILAYGSESLADLVQQLSVEVGNGRGRGGRPVFLVNGQRISGFREFRRYPPEAIRKVEILPEEVALRFGYRADQRVINFILKDNFKSYQIDLGHSFLTEGGRDAQQAEASMLQLNGPSRLNLAAEFEASDMLLESERDIIQSEGLISSVQTDPDVADYTSLLPRSRDMELAATWNTGLGEGGRDGSLSVNGNVELSNTRSLSGLEIVELTGPNGNTARRILDNNPLRQDTTNSTVSLASSLNKPLGDWQLDASLDASRSYSRTLTDNARGTSLLEQQAMDGLFPIDGPLPLIVRSNRSRAETTSYTVTGKATIRGTALELPAGDVSTTLDAAYGWSRITSSDSLTGAFDNTGFAPAEGKERLSRGALTLSGNLAIPLTSRNNQVLPALGDISVNLRGGVTDYSDFGALADFSGGINWTFWEPLSLSATYVARDVVPGLNQLAAPIIERFNVPVYDFTAGQTVPVTVISGGNPDLKPERQRDLKLAANFDLGISDHSRFSIEYNRNRSYDVTSGFPTLTPAVEAAFPSRVTRDASGALVRVDRRPITLSETRSSSLRLGVSFFGQLKSDEPAGGGGSNRGGGRGDSGGRGPSEAGSAPQSGDIVARLSKLRDAFCAAPEGELPDLSQVPAMVRDRLTDANGNIDPSKVAALRSRFCPGQGSKSEGEGEGGAPGNFGGGDWVQRFAKLRETLCAEDNSGDPDLSQLPPPLLARLKDENGEIDPEKLSAFRKRLCSAGGRGGGAGGVGGTDGTPSQAGNRVRVGGIPFGGGGPRGGRWRLAAFYTRTLESEVMVGPNGPVLNQLNGDSLAASGVPRDGFSLDAGLFKSGIGTRISANYTGPATVNGSGLPGSQDLHFSSLFTVDTRTFIELGEQKFLVGDNPGFWKGARLSLRIDNLFDRRRKVTDNDGTTPLSYQPYYVDPVGRRVEIEFRKLF